MFTLSSHFTFYIRNTFSWEIERVQYSSIGCVVGKIIGLHLLAHQQQVGSSVEGSQLVVAVSCFKEKYFLHLQNSCDHQITISTPYTSFHPKIRLQAPKHQLVEEEKVLVLYRGGDPCGVGLWVIGRVATFHEGLQKKKFPSKENNLNTGVPCKK